MTNETKVLATIIKAHMTEIMRNLHSPDGSVDEIQRARMSQCARILSEYAVTLPIEGQEEFIALCGLYGAGSGEKPDLGLMFGNVARHEHNTPKEKSESTPD